MTISRPNPTQREVFFEDQEIIVSKTDPQGRIAYANDVLQRIAGFTEAELIGQPHNIIRHPDMPSAVFKLLWDTVMDGREIFAYVKNMARSGDHYWVFAHVTPSYNQDGDHVGYHSNRRVPGRDAIDKVIPLYESLRETERRADNPRVGMQDAFDQLRTLLTGQQTDYSRFVFQLSEETQLSHALR